MKAHFFAGPPPISGLSQPSCTIFMKAVEFLMKFKAIQVSSARSGGGGREVWQLPKCWWQAPARISAGLRAQTKATPDAKRAKALTKNAKLRPGRVLRPKCCLRTKSLQAGKALGVSQLGTAGCGGNNVLVYGQRGDAFSFLLSDTCVCQSNLFHLGDVPVPHSHLGEVSLTATLCCLPSFYMAERAA